jgi:hypothetical protein
LIKNLSTSYLVGISFSDETNDIRYTNIKSGFSNPIWNEEFLESSKVSEIASKTLFVNIYNHSDLQEPNVKIFGKVSNQFYFN